MEPREVEVMLRSLSLMPRHLGKVIEDPKMGLLLQNVFYSQRDFETLGFSVEVTSKGLAILDIPEYRCIKCGSDDLKQEFEDHGEGYKSVIISCNNCGEGSL